MNGTPQSAHHDEDDMNRRTRKLIGAVAILVFVCVYALVVMAIVQGRIQELSHEIQAILYAVLGMAWIVPLMPLIKWMERPDPEDA
jgi:hypothetical protein